MAGKADIVDYIADNVEGISKKQASEAFESIVDAISKHLKKGDRVQVPGFGSFAVAKRAARTGRNPETGEAIAIAASKNVRFKAGKDLKDAQLARVKPRCHSRGKALRCSGAQGFVLSAHVAVEAAPVAPAKRRRRTASRSASWWRPCAAGRGARSGAPRW